MSSTADFLLELRSEEIPARMQDGAINYLGNMLIAHLAAVGIAISPDKIVEYVSPRRMTVIVKRLPLKSAAIIEETKGPKVGAPLQALEGFLRKTGLTQDQLIERDGVYFAVINKPGRKTADVLAQAVPAIIRAFPWPKSMRWGNASRSTESLRWVRPLQGILALLGDDVVPCEVDGIVSGAATMGHRFHHHGPITIGNAGDYAGKLRVCHVIVDQADRQTIIREKAAEAAADAGFSLIADEGLVIENSGLTEWPVPLLGRFDAAYLELPPEVIRLTARVNQKYFVCRDDAGELANAFICTANIAASDGGKAVIAGNERVLTARLADAKFFYEQDLKTPLGVHAEKLGKIVFHEKLGTVADKVERVAKLARWLCAEGILKGDPDLAEQAARLCKADLVTGMVAEFPELQGVMGGYYARAQGLPDAVADAIRDHYKPVGQGDDVPTAPVTVAVSLADKLDTLISFYTIGEVPTGSKDPFALRRAALGSISLILKNKLRINLLPTLFELFKERVALFNQNFMAGAPQGILQLFADRLKVQQKEAGVRHDLIDAVFALGGEDDLVRLLARVQALQAFITTEDGANLLAGYKRAANILRASDTPLPFRVGDGGGGCPQVLTSAFADAPQPNPSPKGEELIIAESALQSALDTAELQAQAAIDAEQFEQAMSALAALRHPIDLFFDQVMINDPDPHKRAFRLGLLTRFRDAVHQVADFSKIEG